MPFVILAVLVALWLIRDQASAEGTRETPAPTNEAPAKAGAPTETAVLDGGCFWGVQGVYQHVEGILSAESD